MPQVKTSLQNHTTYSIFSGVGLTESWVEQAVDNGYTSLAITDKSTLGGAVKFQLDCKKHGIKPIFGTEIYIVRDRLDKESSQDWKPFGSLIFYAKDEKGMRNLYRLNNLSYAQDGFYFRARLDIPSLRPYTEGIVCILPVNNVGPIANLASAETGLTPKFMDDLMDLMSIFKEDFYFGVNPMLEGDNAANAFYAQYDNSVLTYNCHYPKRTQAALYDTISTMDNGKVVRHFKTKPERAFLPRNTGDFKTSSLSQEKILTLLDRTDALADALNGKIEFGKIHMPKAIPRGASVKEDLTQDILNNFKKRIADLPDDIKDIDALYERRAEFVNIYPKNHLRKGESKKDLKPVSEYIAAVYEQFKLYEEKDFHDYFHIGADMMNYGRSRGYQNSAGRGSAGGSTVAYLTGITDTDAIRHELIHSRFLNPYRNDIPDIDYDFAPPLKEDIVNNYLPGKYGTNKVVRIGSFGRLKVKGCVQKVAETTAYGILDNEGRVASYTKTILEEKLNTFIKQTTRGEEEVEELTQDYKFAEFYRKHSNWFDTEIIPLLDSVSSLGIHAAGVIITPEPYIEMLPVWWNASQQCYVTQWDKDDVEKAGFVKLDCLSVEALEMLTTAKKLIAKTGETPPELDDIPLDDEDTLYGFYKADTGGVFQYNSTINTKFSERAQPTDFNEVYNIIAVNRPGVLEVGGDEEYLRRADPDKIEYIFEEFKPILSPTRGVLIYQEQMMAMVKIFGLTDGEADYLRKACGKKKLDEMAKWESVIKERAAERGFDPMKVAKVWEMIDASASYLFNKSHTVSYALLSYFQMYIKQRWPLQFWAAALDSAPTDKKKRDTSVYAVKYEAEDAGVKFIFPTFLGFSDKFEPSTDGKIYWPITRIKGIGESAALLLSDNGNRNGFTSFEEFMEVLKASRSKKKEEKIPFVNIGVIKKLINVGFFSPAGKPWEVAERIFEELGEDIPEEFLERDNYYWQQLRNEAYGFQVEKWKDMPGFDQTVVRSYTNKEMRSLRDGDVIIVGGRVDSLFIGYTAKGEKYATVVVEDRREKYFVKIWGNVWNDETLSSTGRRPREDDLIEIAARKTTFKAGITLAYPNINAHLRIIARMK